MSFHPNGFCFFVIAFKTRPPHVAHSDLDVTSGVPVCTVAQGREGCSLEEKKKRKIWRREECRQVGKGALCSVTRRTPQDAGPGSTNVGERKPPTVSSLHKGSDIKVVSSDFSELP